MFVIHQLDYTMLMHKIQIIASGIVGFFMLLGAINIVQLVNALNTTLAVVVGFIISIILSAYAYFMYYVFKKLNTEHKEDKPEKKNIDPAILHAPKINNGQKSKKIENDHLPVNSQATSKKPDRVNKPQEANNQSGNQSLHEDTQSEMMYNNNQSDEIADIMLDFKPQQLGSDGLEHEVFDDEKYIDHYTEKQFESDNHEDKMVKQISERVINHVEGMYRAQSKELLEKFNELQEKHYQITELKEKIGIREGEEIPKVVEGKEKSLDDLNSLIAGANILKDQIKEKELKENQEQYKKFIAS
ncbi:MAG: hypothetical protein N4A74_25570 [Carboxylicivirga sp.]|jgi:hypothetical protein|nr:hypothetical protein [Carboxylicivirga sp.]